ncbi:MAG: hypothetical protein ACLSHC_02430 [Bilophila wadsworthia]
MTLPYRIAAAKGSRGCLKTTACRCLLPLEAINELEQTDEWFRHGRARAALGLAGFT